MTLFNILMGGGLIIAYDAGMTNAGRPTRADNAPQGLVAPLEASRSKKIVDVGRHPE